MWRTRQGRLLEIIRIYACNNTEYFALKQANNSGFLSYAGQMGSLYTQCSTERSQKALLLLGSLCWPS